MKKLFLFLLVMAVVNPLFVFSGGTKEDDAKMKVFTMKVSHGGSTADSVHAALEQFKIYMEDKTNKRIIVELYPSNQLGDEQEVVQALASGAVEACVPFTGNVAPFSKSIGVLQLPYMFQDTDEFYYIIEKIGDQLNTKLVNEINARAIGFAQDGFRVLTNSKKPVKTIDDLKGLKIRVSPVVYQIEAFKAWGIEPIPMAWDETYPALQQGVVDGFENNYVTIYSDKFYEVQKYVTDIHYNIWTGPFLVSEIFYQKLPEDLKKILIAGGKEFQEKQKGITLKMVDDSVKGVKEKGMIIYGNPDDESVWKEKALAIWPKFYSTIGKEWVEEVLKIKK